MDELGNLDLYVALIHHPVVNKKGDVICSAITNLDLHDIARAARTYGVKGYYVVNPLEDQKVLAHRIVRHWTEGDGGRVNPARKEAFSMIRLTDSLEETLESIRNETQSDVKIIATSARESETSVSYSSMREMLGNVKCALLLFGTAWGLSSSVLEQAHWMLKPVSGPGSYNHLSVRSAVTVVLDRLLGQ